MTGAGSGRGDQLCLAREAIQRADDTEERLYGSAQVSGFYAADFARRVDGAGSDVTTVVHRWLVETGCIRPDAQFIHLKVCTLRTR
ncbi:hypothetical protein ACWCQP_49420 [Streptomyces chartreusis]